MTMKNKDFFAISRLPFLNGVILGSRPVVGVFDSWVDAGSSAGEDGLEVCR